jgi:hypothetical protein
LCRAIALAANSVNLSCTVTVIKDGKPVPEQKSYTILTAVTDAQKYIKDPSTGSLDGFLALTDSIIYAIKVANPEGDENLKTVSI